MKSLAAPLTPTPFLSPIQIVGQKDFEATQILGPKILGPKNFVKKLKIKKIKAPKVKKDHK